MALRVWDLGIWGLGLRVELGFEAEVLIVKE